MDYDIISARMGILFKYYRYSDDTTTDDTTDTTDILTYSDIWILKLMRIEMR